MKTLERIIIEILKREIEGVEFSAHISSIIPAIDVALDSECRVDVPCIRIQKENKSAEIVLFPELIGGYLDAQYVFLNRVLNDEQIDTMLDIISYFIDCQIKLRYLFNKYKLYNNIRRHELPKFIRDNRDLFL